MSDTKVAEDTPCVDMGSFMKWYFNPFYNARSDKHSREINIPITVVGSGTYAGADKNAFIDRATEKLLFFSYRNCFPKLPNGSTSDSYWGCLVRTGQMVVAHAFMRFYGGGCSVFPDDQLEGLRTRTKPLFRDTPNAPISLHQIEYAAHDQGIKYARWLSPTQACKAAYTACKKYYDSGKPCPYPICAEDRNINKAEAYGILRRGEPILYLIPVVMGIKTLNDKYQKMLLRCLEMEHCCGVAGGHGKASMYFFGHQGTSVFLLDPHYVQTAFLSSSTEGATRMKRGALSINKIDPCMFIGFYIHDEAGFERFLVELKEMNSFVPFPLISVSEADPRQSAAAALDVPPEQVEQAMADRVTAVDGGDSHSPAEGQRAEYPSDGPGAEHVPGALTATDTDGTAADQWQRPTAPVDMPCTYPPDEDAGPTTNPLLPRPSSSGDARETKADDNGIGATGCYPTEAAAAATD